MKKKGLYKGDSFEKSMQTITLQPEQVLVPGELEVGNENILQIYFHLFSQGLGERLPPIAVVHYSVVSPAMRKRRLKRFENRLQKWPEQFNLYKEYYANEKRMEVEKYKANLAVLCDRSEHAPYYLIDGNHRSTAAALAHQPLHALELQTNRDIAEIRHQVRIGNYFNFKQEETSLRRLVERFEEWIIGMGKENTNHHIDELLTVRERVDRLIAEKALPAYMIKSYHAPTNRHL